MASDPPEKHHAGCGTSALADQANIFHSSSDDHHTSTSDDTSSDDEHHHHHKYSHGKTGRKYKKSRGKAASSSSSSDEDSNSRSRAKVSSRSKSRRSSKKKTSSRSKGGMVEVQSLAGSKMVAMPESGSMPAKGWSETTVSYYMCGSLNELEAEDVSPHLKIAEGAMGIFDNADDKRSANHICGGVFVTEFKSSFPVTLLVDATGSDDMPKAKSVTHEGARGALTILPNSTFSDKDGLKIAEGNPESMDADFIRDYPGWNLGNVDEKIDWVNDGTQALINKDHPVVMYFNGIRAQKGQAPLGAKNLFPGSSQFMATAADTRICLASLKKSMAEKLKMQNMYESGLTLRRARGTVKAGAEAPDWTDPIEAIDTLATDDQASMRDRIMSKKYQLYVTVKYRYRAL